MNTSELFVLNGAIYCKDILSKEMSHYLTHVLLRSNAINGNKGDAQIPNALAIIDHDLFLETMHEKIWPLLENMVAKPLLPTYAYARLYSNGDVLEKHRDRPACEISITVQLGKSHHYTWPIYIGNHRFDMAEGDGVIYYGCDVEHWRDKCDGPNGYYSGQAFFHFVIADGANVNQANDPSVRPDLAANAYAKHRAFQMETK
jgi:hypothetical protein